MDRDRRDVLYGLLSSVAAVAVAGNGTASRSVSTSDSISRLLLEAFPDISDARHLGEDYLRLFPSEAKVIRRAAQSLEARIADQIPEARVSSLIDNIITEHRRDCADVDMINVSDVLLSRTECRLYALIALRS